MISSQLFNILSKASWLVGGPIVMLLFLGSYPIKISEKHKNENDFNFAYILMHALL